MTLRILALALLPGALALALRAAPAAAQDCEMIQNRTLSVTNQGTPQQVAYITGAVIRCPGGKLLRAETAISSEASGIINLIGDVRYEDGQRALTAGRADYYKRESRILATENAVVRDLKTGSIIRGNSLDYRQASAGRPAYLQAQPSTPRPTALLVQVEAGQADTTRVEADMLELFGENRFRGTGGAIIRRDSLNGFGGIVDYDQQTGEMQLAVQARIETEQYQLVGDTIRARSERDTLRQVTSQGAAVLTTRTVTVESPFLLLGMEGGELQRMIAVRRAGARGGSGTAGQAHVRAEQFRLLADSIDVLAPGQELDRVFAVGDAYGEVIDTLPAPQVEGELQGTLATDWMRGDTVQAFFAVNPKAATDTAAAARVLERVITSGEPASSLYRKREQPATAAAAAPAGADTPAAGAAPPRFSIGYLLARRIEVAMVEGEVSDVKASEDVRGIYLQPRGAAGQQAGPRNRNNR